MAEIWLDGPWLGPTTWADSPLGIAGTGIGDPGSKARRIDASDMWILPGIVDLHGDAFERHLAPRRGAQTDMARGLFATEADLAANGITTAILAQFWSWEGGLRAPEFAARMLTALDEVAPHVATDMRAQLRIETHFLDAIPDVKAAMSRHRIGYAAFNDHLPHARLAAGRKPPRLTGTALKSGRSPEAHLALMHALHARRDEVPAAMDALCNDLSSQGVILASHDDASVEDRQIWRARGCNISEFPETRIAAETAAQSGAGVIMGAPNVVRGASHKGKASARDLIQDRLVDALASDYHYPSLLNAALALAPDDLAPIWPMLSANPARLLGLTDRGTLAAGKRADLIVIDPATRRITLTMAAGQITHARGPMAARLL